MWDTLVITDRTIQANQPDKVQHDKKQICPLTDRAIQDDLNINLKETEKISKYKDLKIEVSKMLNTKTKNWASYNWSIRNN